MFYKSVIACGLISAVNPVFAERYVNGVEGIKAASLPGPGVYFRSYNLYYHANDLKDSAGHNINNGFDVTVAATVERPIWVTNYNILGGTYFNDIALPFVYKKLKIDASSVDDDQAGFGDIYLEPFGLAWHGERWDSAIAVGIYLDNGDFDSAKSVNMGAGYKSYMLTAGGTEYFGTAKNISLSVLARYETHTRQKDTDIEFGDDFHLEYGFGFTRGSALEYGISGYYQKQVTKDLGIGTSADKDKVFAIGPEIATAFPSSNWLVSLRALKEFDAKNRQEGMLMNLTITKIL